MMKKVVSMVLVLMMVFSLVACSPKAEEPTTGGEASQPATTEPTENTGEKLVVWTFTDEFKGMIEDHYLVDNPDLPYEIEIVVIPNEQYQQKLDPALGSGKAAPDVFALEAAYVKKYVDSKFTKDLREVGIDPAEGTTLQYVQDVATFEGKLKASSWQATPGAYFYRRSLAEKYLGVSEPEDVQALMSDFDKFYETAQLIHEKSNGETKIISSLGDLGEVFMSAREQGWVVDNKFVVDPAVDTLFELGRKLEEGDLTNQADQWTEGWFASMSNDEVFGYFLPTWGLHYVLKTNAESADGSASTVGDWGMIQGPSPYFWGGTWLAMREGTEMESAAKDLIEYMTLNEEFLTTWAEKTGDVVSHIAVIDAIKDNYSEEFLAGQNHYAQFVEMAKTIDATTMTGSDLDIRNLMNEQLTAYSKGEKEKDAAMADFISGVQNAFPNLEY